MPQALIGIGTMLMQNPKLLTAIVSGIDSKNGGKDIIKLLYHLYDKDRPSDAELTNDEISAVYNLAKDIQRGNTDASGAKDSNVSKKDLKEAAEGIKKITRPGLKDRGDYLLADALARGTSAFGNILNNRANRLASALLSGTRQSTADQIARYGLSPAERASSAWAQREVNSGETGKYIADAFSGFASDIASLTEQDDYATRQAELAILTGGSPSAAMNEGLSRIISKYKNGVPSGNSQIGSNPLPTFSN